MPMIEGVVYNDRNQNGKLDAGEAASPTTLTTSNGGTRSGDDGKFSAFAKTGANTLVIKGGDLAEEISLKITIPTSNVSFDLIDSGTLVTSTSLTVSAGQIDAIIGTGKADLSLTGNQRDQIISGSSGNDTLYGLGGNDIISGGTGNDTIHGGDGIDIAIFSGSRSQFSITASDNVIQVAATGQGLDKVYSTEILRFTDGDYFYDKTSGELMRFANPTGDGTPARLPTTSAQTSVVMSGRVYNDTNNNGKFDKGEGSPEVYAKVLPIGTRTADDGSYSFNPRSGNQVIEFRDAEQQFFQGLRSFDIVIGSRDFTLDLINGNRIEVSESIQVNGEILEIIGLGKNGLTLIGDFRAQLITGTDSNDTLDGREGGDTLVGGRGNDILIGGPGIDIGVFAGDVKDFDISFQNGSIVVANAVQGSDKTSGIEIFRFDNGDYYYDTVNDVLIPFGPNAGEPITNPGPPVENDAPVLASSQQVTTSASQAVAIKVNATDPDGDALTYSPSNPANGTVTGSAGNFFYTPNANFVGTDNFIVVVSDGINGSVIQSVAITVLKANESPSVTAPSQAVTTDYQAAITINVAASDPDGDALTFTPSAPANGSVSVGNGGTLIYTPDNGFSGSDSFGVVVSDGKGGTAVQTVSVLVGEPNTAPSVFPFQTAATVSGEPVAIIIEASDADGDGLSFTAGAADNGSIEVLEGGLLFYTPDAGFLGADDFAVTVDDGNGGVRSLTVTVQTYATKSELLAAQGSEFDLSTTSGFKGLIGGSGNIFGGEGFQHIVLPDDSDNLVFDPSFNKGGDVIEFPNAAGAYIIELDGSTAVIKDGDSQYVIPIGPTAIALVFDDGLRELKFDQSSGMVKIGSQDVLDEAAVITAGPSFAAPPQGEIPSATANLSLKNGADLPIEGNFTVFGTAGAQTLDFFGGKLDLDASFNKGGDTIELHKSAFEFSAYVNGSSLVLTSGEDMLSIPLGTAGILLDFNGDERIALIDTSIPAVRIGDEIISAMTAPDAQPLGGGLSLDVGQTTAPATIDLDDGTAYKLSEDFDLASFVEVNGFDDDDQIVVIGGDLDDYNFSATGDGIQITSNDGSVVNSITLNGVETDGFVFDAATAIDAVGYNFIVTG